MPAPSIAIRPAVPADADTLRRLHRASLWGLCVFDYSLAEIESILRHVQTLDPSLIERGRYYVATVAGEIAGSGGWSDDPDVHPVVRPANSNTGSAAAPPSAKMRAIFVNPKFARHGIGRSIMAHVEAEARAAGFAVAEVLATLTGARLGECTGYESLRRVRLPLADGMQLDFVHMRKVLDETFGKRAA
ncbi:MAG: GNAT family N-acetyltransferase [Alphaproteobacteria bacterium]